MKEPVIDIKDLETWADYLLDHSLGGITSDDCVMIKGERICWPLMEILERKVIEAGGIPDVNLVAPNNERGRVWSSTMGRYGKQSQIDNAPNWHKARYEKITKYVEVLGAEDPSKYAGLSADQFAALAGADQPYGMIRIAKRWVITLFPTPGYAKMEGMDLDEYTKFIVGASTVDPRPLKAAEDKIAPLIDKGKTITIVTLCPSEKRELVLTMDLSSSIAAMSYGIHNFPDGEVFSSPDARSCEGEIFIDLPVHNGGTDIEGIYLKLEGGKIISYSAVKGGDQLAAIIETDDGSKRIGEIALGMNPGLDKVLKHPLFVEKVGGTLHIAIGASYEKCYVEDPAGEQGKAKIEQLEKEGILNRSAQHVDIVADFRPGGCGKSVKIDDILLKVKGGLWVPKV